MKLKGKGSRNNLKNRLFKNGGEKKKKAYLSLTLEVKRKILLFSWVAEEIRTNLF